MGNFIGARIQKMCLTAIKYILYDKNVLKTLINPFPPIEIKKSETLATKKDRTKRDN